MMKADEMCSGICKQKSAKKAYPKKDSRKNNHKDEEQFPAKMSVHRTDSVIN
ncbi:MAG: hypothetical protein LUH53_11795 [Lachnospiraceae bacterium]|nr:hypothetical protein [Lachnospiraceae bacterium]